MADLTTHTVSICTSNEYWCHQFPSKSAPGQVHTCTWEKLSWVEQIDRGIQYDYTCSCKGFEFHKRCRHIEAAKAGLRCAWNGELDPGAMPPTTLEDGTHCCPGCGSDVTYVQVGA